MEFPPQNNGRADYRQKLMSVKPAAGCASGGDQLTYFTNSLYTPAQFRAGRRRIRTDGVEWQRACRDLGIDW